MLAFNFFFLPPLHTFTLADSENWFALAVYLVTAVVVSELAARARRRAAEAEQRERESALLAEIATDLLERPRARSEELERDRANARRGARRRPGRDRARAAARPRDGPSRRTPLEAGGRPVGTIYLAEARSPSLDVRRRFLPALASLLAVAIDRERLAREALEAETLRRSDTVKTAVLRAVSPRPALAADGDPHRGRRARATRRSTLDRRGPRASCSRRSSSSPSRLDRLVGEPARPLAARRPARRRRSPSVWTVDDLVAQALDELGATRSASRSRGAELPLVRRRRGQIQRVLVNLLENALKFSPPGDAGARAGHGDARRR